MHSSTLTPNGLTRRTMLSLLSLGAAGTGLAACAGSPLQRVAESTDDPAGLTASPAVSAPPVPTADAAGAVALYSALDGVAATFRVGPATVQDGYTLVRVEVSTDSDEEFTLSSAFSGSSPYTMRGMRLLSLRQSLVFPELGDRSDGLFDTISRLSSVEVFPVFEAVGDDVETVELFLPSVGVAVGVPVVSPEDAGFEAGEVLSVAEIDREADPGPYRLSSLVVATDGSYDTDVDEESTTVTVSGDVTFGSDSTELSAQADEVLAKVVEQLTRYPSGGKLSVTGHTDDVDEEDYNRTLSEQRAQAVADRLGELTDLSSWDTSVTGKGESEPRAEGTSDEARAANRRVEVLMTPKNPAEASALSTAATPPADQADASPGQMPRSVGPAGTGADGVDVRISDQTVHLSMESVTRVGDYVTGSLLLSAQEDVSITVNLFALPNELQILHWPASFTAAHNPTLLAGGARYLAANYLDAESEYVPVTNRRVRNIVPGEAMRLPVVWPYPGADTVTLDLPGKNLAARLTDIPVAQA
ncbi:OmpA family protein [Actinomyces ruminicola]|uniref:OmpA family protein n=1 Tax=Actinomyces ruminicola TaxID=332524 RepID=A0A1H0AAR9_9ACTO|nr:OmpA family protein [Actinomyces ruminicola]SDN30053.1 OmpA family protein [Actinomyces ruminicola]